MQPIIAIVMSLFWCLVAVLIAWSRGYKPGGIVLCLVGIIGGGVLAGVPGKWALNHWSVIISTEQVKVVACAAVLLGVLCGLFVSERLRDHEPPSFQQLFNATIGFILGVMAAYVMYFTARETWAEAATVYVLIPALVGTATLAGSATAHRFVD